MHQVAGLHEIRSSALVVRQRRNSGEEVQQTAATPTPAPITKPIPQLSSQTRPTEWRTDGMPQGTGIVQFGYPSTPTFLSKTFVRQESHCNASSVLHGQLI